IGERLDHHVGTGHFVRHHATPTATVKVLGQNPGSKPVSAPAIKKGPESPNIAHRRSGDWLSEPGPDGALRYQYGNFIAHRAHTGSFPYRLICIAVAMVKEKSRASASPAHVALLVTQCPGSPTAPPDPSVPSVHWRAGRPHPTRP